VSTTQIDIIGGDSKHELFAQLFDIGRVKPRDVCFKLTLALPNLFGPHVTMPELELEVWVNGFESRSSSGDEWWVYGSIAREQLDRLGVLGEEFSTERFFKASYNTRTRKGRLSARPRSESAAVAARHAAR